VFAGLVTNTVFGFLRTAIVLTVFTGSARVAGYDPASAVTFVWVGQDLLAVVMIFGEGELAGRVRTGQVSADLLRPVDLQAALLAEDVGRAGFAMLTRFAEPVMIGGLAFTLADVARALVVPRRRRDARRPGELRAALPAQPHRILAARLAWRAHYLRRHRAAAGWTDHPSAVLRSLGGRDPGGDAVSCDSPDPDRPAARAGRRGLVAGRPAAVGGAAARCRAAGAGAGGALAQRLERHVELLDMAGFLRVLVRQLSLGQRMRGEVTAALLHDPELVVLDEPTIGLDLASKERLRGFLAGVNAGRAVTLLLTTHDLPDVERLCRRLVVIDQGRVLVDGDLDALRRRFGGARQLVVKLMEP
jgi:hypothetical protein